MKNLISIISSGLFIISIYIAPSVSAITLGEIKPDKPENSEKIKKTDEKTEKLPDNKLSVKKEDRSHQKSPEFEIANPRLVCLLSVIMPGGGHFYLNNDAKGMSFCLAAGGGYTATGFFMIKTMLAERGSVAYKNYLLLTGFMFFITLVIHFVGIIEAYSDADEINKKNLFRSDADNPYSTEIITEKK